MEKSGLLISSRNIHPIPSTRICDFKNFTLRCKIFNFRNLPPSCFQFSVDKVKFLANRRPSRGVWSTKCTTCLIGATVPPRIELSTIIGEPCYALGVAQFLETDIPETSRAAPEFMQRLVLIDLDAATSKLAIGFLGAFLSAFGFLFIVRIVMSWYPKLPVEKFPYVVAYAPTEPLLVPTRKLIPPLAGVDVTPVVWFGLISFLNEILVGPQGLLVLLSQQV